jgi:hypothetical protein
MADSPIFSASPLTRRRILGWGGIGVMAGVAGYLGWPKNPSPAIPASDGSDQPTGTHSPATADAGATEEPPGTWAGREAFIPHLNSEFQLESPAVSTVCRLVEVSAEDLLESPTARFASFSLLFSAPVNFAAESRIYRLTHPRMEPLDLFLSPVGKSTGHIALEAICSRRV